MNLVNDDAILLTGATGRIGAATLAMLVREGARVGVLSRDRARAQAAIDKALQPQERQKALAIQADLNVPASTEAAVAEVVKAFGRIDALVNLAGSGWRKKAMTEQSLDELRETIVEIIETAYNVSAAALRAMLAQPYRDGARSRGRIITVSATSATAPNPGFTAYAAGKGGVNSMMLAIARDHKADGIVANAVLLGGVNFPGSEKFRKPEDNAKAVSAQEVADVLTFLASDRATGVNGALLTLSARETD
jgi:NAD(P)-dependent dehydrogenase (short-subunit alcohol dehydrogenase family)